MKIQLHVPGTMNRYGTFVEDLPFDDFVKVHIIEEVEKIKKGIERRKKCDVPYFYLAHRKDVSEWEDQIGKIEMPVLRRKDYY